MNILLTGAAGLIGMAVRPALIARGHKLVPIDITTFGRADPTIQLNGLDDAAGLERVIDEHQVDAIVHCGAISGPMMAKGQPLKLVAANIDATALLLDLARRHAMRRFVFCSSISVYGSVGPDMIDEATPLRPTSVYGATKVACEQLLRGFAAEFGLSGVSLRIARVYGPYRRADCHVKNLVQDAIKGQETIIPCDLDFLYHYVYADDVAGAIAAALEAEALPQLEYNVGSGDALTMPALVDQAAGVIPGIRARLVPGKDDVPDIQTAFDIAAIRRDLGWSPRFGMAECVTAYRAAVLAGAAAV
jgi:UDP-glucose 4-epimerase